VYDENKTYYDPETGEPLPKGMYVNEEGKVAIFIDGDENASAPTAEEPREAEERRKDIELLVKTCSSPITPLWQPQFTRTSKDDQPTVVKKTSWSAAIERAKLQSGTGIINAGTIIPGLLITGLNSSLPGELAAQVSEPVYDSPSGQRLLIPQGSRLFGRYDSKIIFGQKRALVRRDRVIFPHGASVDLNLGGSDRGGYSGFKGEVNNHYPAMYGSAALISVFAGIAKEYSKDSTKITISQPTISIGDSLPVGTVLAWTTDTPPLGYLLCDGSTFDKNLYPRLYEMLGKDDTPDYSEDSTQSRYWIIKARDRSAASYRAGGTTSVEDGDGNEIVGELADTIAAMTEKIFEKYLELAPTLVIKPGYRFSIIVNKQIILPVVRRINHD
ncbi:MAG: tail fiber protein, partial [Cloacibacillus porcorum]|nr:tail fiber protein [Cloacibacillus porcorum]